MNPALDDQDDTDIDILSLLATLWRGKAAILGAAGIALLLGGYYAYGVAVPKYQATASLVLDVRSSNVMDLESVMSGVSTDAASINTELEVIRSTDLIKQVVARLNLTDDPEFNATLRPDPSFTPGAIRNRITSLFKSAQPTPSAPDIDRLQSQAASAVRGIVSASNQRNTYIFNISAKTESPGKSVRIVNALAEIYIDNQINDKFKATEQAVTWLSERVRDLEIELRDREDGIKRLQAESELISPEILEAENQQLRDLRQRLTQARTEKAAATDRLAARRAAVETGDMAKIVSAFDDPTLATIVRNATSNFDRDVFDARLDLLITRDTSAIERANAQEEALADSVGRQETRMKTQSANLIGLEQMRREVEATRVLYESFLTRLKETTIQRGLQRADSRILSMAEDGRYVEPRKSLILAISLMLGALIGAAVVLVLEALRNHFRTAEDLEARTGYTVLGQIPRIPIKKRSELLDYLTSKPTSAAAEAIRNLRTSVLMSNVDAPCKVIMSTSSIPSEGKTTQAIALAQNLSGLGRKVLLIEGDIRRRTFGEYFKASEKGGLAALIAGEKTFDEVVVRDPRMNADIIMGEKTSINAADLFSSDRFASFLQEARDAYDYVIIDTPPVLVVPDARVIAPHADAIIYTVKWDSTTRSQVAEGLRQFESLNLRVTGTVLSQIDAAGMKKYGYGGKYGAYSKYGQSYYES
ncbi:polysaccharide biosynthesis tyrosine autokinase [Oceaniovalibus sp. ACAM 378]|uniref:polysaccharide biosynthesis tyrosine autokinase n=1 Tax=Oceaniovalibus sp. ACAM 378 TaxID=2599923 RepID=UPI0011DBBDD0|nr:polysaccharide biosynthesis tyrosine autokinase [Oceaniovalibus sp. ACAM 378]TYB85606.1 polysaccharide biosynthesis tyrosine autokinase [Oceaniovalibus sp. ACAM 378]